MLRFIAIIMILTGNTGWAIALLVFSLLIQPLKVAYNKI
jgi:hypothetical protein